MGASSLSTLASPLAAAVPALDFQSGGGTGALQTEAFVLKVPLALQDNRWDGCGG
jgi:hypothetical protein